jgi:D-alanyl-D-alanine carboxypeptidase
MRHLILSMFAIVASTANAQAVRGTENGRLTSVDSSTLSATLDSLRTAIGAIGASAAVVFADGRIWAGTSGHAWSGHPVDRETAFDIGSITKPFTAALILRLAQEGRLGIDDPVSKWLPDFSAPGVTVRQLLAQTSGIPDYTANPAFLPAIRARIMGQWPPEENLQFVHVHRVRPDSVWAYSNTNYVLLGLLAREAGGAPYSAILRRLVLEPLALRGTFVAGEDSIAAPRAHSHVDINGDGKADDLSALVPDPAMTRGAGGAGAIVATAIDVAMFARAYFTGTLISDSLHRAATRWRKRGDNMLYGFGTIAWPVGADTLLGHMGNTAGQSAGVWHSKVTGITAVILSNVHGVPMSAAVQRLLTEAEKIRGAR